jgi:hypothetical protein
MTKLTFGKYKGRNIEEIKTIAPSYLKWCSDNVKGFNVDLGILNYEGSSSWACKEYRKNVWKRL